VVRHQASPVTAAREDGVSVVVRLAVTERRAELPEQITGDARGSESGTLPRGLDAAMI
jgi:hypothetical protein